jgi:hypothetical protein
MNILIQMRTSTELNRHRTNIHQARAAAFIKHKLQECETLKRKRKPR